MTFEKPREFVGEHKVAAGAIVTSLAAAGAATGYAIYKKQKEKRERELDEAYAETYEDRLKIFEKPDLSAEKRRKLAQIAVHVFFGNEMGDEIITRASLVSHFEEVHGVSLSRHNFSDLAGYLQQHKLVVLQQGSGDYHRVQGYRTLPALEWGMKYSRLPHPTLSEASDEYTQELTGNL
jgi:hypothetical protein